MIKKERYKTKEAVFKQSKEILEKTLRDIIPAEKLEEVEKRIFLHGRNQKGFLGILVEEFVFGLDVNNRSEADFSIAEIELKTTPLKSHSLKKYCAKERLVFSMINYDSIVNEIWEDSSFLKKNKVLLLMFYLWVKEKNLLDYEFKYVKLLSLLDDISSEDISQIRSDWEFIVNKIKKGQAHLLSEGDTYYLGACTKAANSSVVREQPKSRVLAKPRAFSLKQQYLNYIIQKELLGNKVSTDVIFKKKRGILTIEDALTDSFSGYIGKTDKEIKKIINWKDGTKAKNYKRLLVNKILGVNNRVEEFEKANITLKVITLESSGRLKESISFPSFDYKEIIHQNWYDEENETMADFHLLLETQKFLFVVFQKIKDSDEIFLRKVQFWNFPMEYIEEAQRVWERTVYLINEGDYASLPKIIESNVAHVRPHGKNSQDTLLTPQGTKEVKRCFWLNSRFIESFIND